MSGDGALYDHWQEEQGVAQAPSHQDDLLPSSLTCKFKV